jgi:hypothetical protein
VRAVALVHVEVDDEHPPNTARGAQAPDCDDDVVEDAEAAPGVRKGVMRAAADVCAHALRECGVRGEERRPDGAAGALDELGRPGQAERQLLAARELAGLHLLEPVLAVRERQLGAAGRAGIAHVDPRLRLGGRSHEPVLPEREAVARGEGVGEDVVRERLHLAPH